MPYYLFTPLDPQAHDRRITVNADSEWSARNLLMTNGIDLDRVYRCEIVEEAGLSLPSGAGVTWTGYTLDMSGRTAAQTQNVAAPSSS